MRGAQGPCEAREPRGTQGPLGALGPRAASRGGGPGHAPRPSRAAHAALYISSPYKNTFRYIQCGKYDGGRVCLQYHFRFAVIYNKIFYNRMEKNYRL